MSQAIAGTNAMGKNTADASLPPDTDLLLTDTRDGRVLLLVSPGAEAALLERVLTQANLNFQFCANVDDLLAQLRAGAAVLLIAQEVLDQPGMTRLVADLSKQAKWSDIPILLLSMGGTEGIQASLPHARHVGIARQRHRPGTAAAHHNSPEWDTSCSTRPLPAVPGTRPARPAPRCGPSSGRVLDPDGPRGAQPARRGPQRLAGAGPGRLAGQSRRRAARRHWPADRHPRQPDRRRPGDLPGDLRPGGAAQGAGGLRRTGRPLSARAAHDDGPAPRADPAACWPRRWWSKAMRCASDR